MGRSGGMMEGLFSEVKVCVKNTFLEFVDTSDESEDEQPRILKSHTVGGVCSASFTDGATGRAAGAAGASTSSSSASTAGPMPEPEPKPAEQPPRAEPRPAGTLPTLLGDRRRQHSADKTASDKDASPTPSGGASSGNEGTEAKSSSDGARTTVMLRNLPNDYTRDMIQDLLDSFGLACRYDFLYMPTDLTRRAGLGYAFVNMLSMADVKLVRDQLEGFRRWSVPSSKVCSVGSDVPCQGLEANIARFRNSPIMHSSVPDEFKPIMLVDGRRVDFPKPTKKVRKPDAEYQGRRRGHC